MPGARCWRSIAAGRAPSRCKKALELVQQPVEKVGHTDWTFAKETVLLDAKLAKQPAAQVEVQAIQVGPAVFLANPAEFFVQLGLDIKAKSPFPFTFVVELANDCVGYVPTEEAFGPHGGGYETRLTSYSNLEITAGRRIVAADLELGPTDDAGRGARTAQGAAVPREAVGIRQRPTGKRLNEAGGG